MKIKSAVLGTTTLVVLLTAGTAHSLAGSNTVFSDDIADGNVLTADIGDNQVTSTKIKDGQVGSADLQDNGVKSADVQNESLTGADINEASLTLACPSGLRRVGGVCFTSLRNAASWNSAATDCKDEKLRMPSPGEAILLSYGIGSETMIWTESIYTDSGSTFVLKANNQSILGVGINAAAEQYRCVTTVGSRL
jgi:hypothetical protein